MALLVHGEGSNPFIMLLLSEDSNISRQWLGLHALAKEVHENYCPRCQTIFFSLESAGELHIIIFKKKEGGTSNGL